MQASLPVGVAYWMHDSKVTGGVQNLEPQLFPQCNELTRMFYNKMCFLCFCVWNALYDSYFP